MNEIHPKLWRTQSQTARITGVPSRTIESWVKNRTIEVNATKVDVVEVFKREVARKKDEIERLNKSIDSSENPNVRLTLAQCEKLEVETKLKKIELAKVEGTLIEISEVEADLLDVSQRVKSKFLSLPSLAPKLAGIDDPRAIAELLKTYADQTLAELQFEFLQVDNSADSEVIEDDDSE